MKKIILGLVSLCAIAITTSCTDKGASNAEAYIKQVINESINYSMTDVESIKAEAQDSLFSATCFGTLNLSILRGLSEFHNGTMSKTELEELTGKEGRRFDYLCNSWQFNGMFDKDSVELYKLFKSERRKVYKVTVTFKSSKTKDVRVVMDKNGTTPVATEHEIGKDMRDCSETIQRAWNAVYGLE